MTGPGQPTRGPRRVAAAAAGFGAFLWDFVVGDDWVGALGVAVLLALGAVLDHVAHVRAWWVLPPGVALVLAIMLRRATRVRTAAPAPARPAHPAHEERLPH